MNDITLIFVYERLWVNIRSYHPCAGGRGWGVGVGGGSDNLETELKKPVMECTNLLVHLTITD